MTRQMSVLKVHVAIAVNDSGKLAVFDGDYETNKAEYKKMARVFAKQLQTLGHKTHPHACSYACSV